MKTVITLFLVLFVVQSATANNHVIKVLCSNKAESVILEAHDNGTAYVLIDTDRHKAEMRNDTNGIGNEVVRFDFGTVTFEGIFAFTFTLERTKAGVTGKFFDFREAKMDQLVRPAALYKCVGL